MHDASLPAPLTVASRGVEAFGGDPAEWDEFVRAQEGWTHFHLHRWRAVVEHVFGHQCLQLATRNARGELTGILPLVRVRSLLFGQYLISMPFLNYGGPLGERGAVRALAEHASQLAALWRVRLLELRSRRALPLDLPVSHRKIIVLLDLPDSADALWRRFDSKVRAQVRRPQKEGITVRFGRDQVRPFFEVFAHHMRDLGTPTQPLRFFEAIADAFPEDAWFGCAYLENEPIACGCGFRWDDEFEMTWASSLTSHKRSAPNMLLYWSFMERAIATGARVFNFGRCTPGGGTHRFKRQWGGEDRPLYWYHHAARTGATTPSVDSRRLAWGPRMWKRLPLSVATALGPLVVRGIP